MSETKLGTYYNRLPQVSNDVHIRIKLADEVPNRSLLCVIELFAENDQLINEIVGLSYSNKLMSYFSYVGGDADDTNVAIGPISSRIGFRSVRMKFLPWGSSSHGLTPKIISFVGLEQELFSESWSSESIAVGSILLASREVN